MTLCFGAQGGRLLNGGRGLSVPPWNRSCCECVCLDHHRSVKPCPHCRRFATVAVFGDKLSPKSAISALCFSASAMLFRKTALKIVHVSVFVQVYYLRVIFSKTQMSHKAYTRWAKKTASIFHCNNFVYSQPISIIFGTCRWCKFPTVYMCQHVMKIGWV